MARTAENSDEVFAPFVPRLLQSWPEGERYQSREGSMLFMDISGFTALSERLAKRGRIGSEQVSDALNHTFTELLTIAVDLGADLLKFGGDATLQFYEGPRHARRAARGAALMRSRLRTVGKVDTPQGVLQLKMSQGVHTGTFGFFKVASSHQELIVTGVGASTTVMMEGMAAAGEILLSPPAAERLPAGLIGDRKEEGFLLRRTPPRISEIPPPRDRTAYSLEEFTPVGLRPYLVEQSEGEHRRATIAFLKIKGTDDRIASDGIEAVSDWLEQIMTTVLTAADEGGVTFLSTDTDEGSVKIILSAGVPATTGNDDERMLHTLRAIADSSVGKDLAIGVNRGTLFAGDLGAPFRRYYTVLGDGVNLAARLMSQAHLGQVLATPIVLDRSPTLFETEDLEPFMVKGKSEPVVAASVGKAIGTRDETETRELPLVGREQELGQILDAFRESRTGGGAVQVTGASGSGKSRLFAEAYASTEPADWIKVNCEEYQRITPYAPIGTLLRSLLDVQRSASDIGDILATGIKNHAPGLVPWTPLVGTVLDLKLEDSAESAALDPKFRKDRTHEAVIDFLLALRPEHTVFVFDNAQWMDDASGELLARLLQSITSYPWLLAIARRTEDEGFRVAPDVGRHVDLPDLERADLLQLASLAAAEKPLPRPHVEQIITRSSGNPLFLLEMLGTADRSEGSPDLPGSIEELVTARIDRLDPNLRRLLRYSSVVGHRIDVGLLVESLGDDLPEAQDPVNWSALHDFIEADGEGVWNFRQNLFRDVAYDSLPFGVRKALHKNIGRVLEAHSKDPAKEADLLSLHFSLAQEHEKSWTYSTLSGDQARDQYANVDAADFYLRAVEAARHVRSIDRFEVAGINEALGDVNELAGLYDRADSAYRAARRDLKTNAKATGRLMAKQGLLREKAGDLTQALRWFRHGLRLLENAAETTDESAELQLAYAGVRFRQGRFEECITWSNKTLETIQGRGYQAHKAHALLLLVTAQAHLGRNEENLGDEAVRIYEDLGDLVGLGNILNNVGVEAHLRGDWNRALDLYARSGEARRSAGDIWGASASTNNMAEIYSDQGKVPEAIEAFHDALDIWRGANLTMGIAIAHLNLGRATARLGEFAKADEHLAKAVASFEEQGAQFYILDAGVRKAEALLLRRDVGGALERADELIGNTAADDHNRLLIASLYRTRGYCRAGLGDKEGARSDLEESLSLARAGNAGLEIALTLEAMIRCGPDDARVDEWLTESVAALNDLGVVATPLVPIWPDKVAVGS